MSTRDITIKTDSCSEEFQVDCFGGRFHIFQMHTNIIGGKQSKKIGDTDSWESAVELIKKSVQEPILSFQMKEK